MQEYVKRSKKSKCFTFCKLLWATGARQKMHCKSWRRRSCAKILRGIPLLFAICAKKRKTPFCNDKMGEPPQLCARVQNSMSSRLWLKSVKELLNISHAENPGVRERAENSFAKRAIPLSVSNLHSLLVRYLADGRCMQNICSLPSSRKVGPDRPYLRVVGLRCRFAHHARRRTLLRLCLPKCLQSSETVEPDRPCVLLGEDADLHTMRCATHGCVVVYCKLWGLALKCEYLFAQKRKGSRKTAAAECKRSTTAAAVFCKLWWPCKKLCQGRPLEKRGKKELAHFISLSSSEKDSSINDEIVVGGNN